MFSNYKNVFFLAVACVLLYYIPFHVSGFSTDVWTRLSRIQEWVEAGFPLWEIKMAGQNYPYGHEMHWTRPLDVIGYIFAWPFIPGYGIKKSLEMMAYYMPVLTCIAGFGAFFYGVRAYVRPKIAFASFLAFWGIGYIWGQSSVGYFDHHTFHFALLVALIAFVSQSFVVGRKTVPLTIAALITALGTSLTAEFFINAVLVLVPFGVMWLRFNQSLKPAFVYMGLYTLFLLILVVLDPPMNGVLTLDIYRISMLHVILAGGMALVIGGLLGLFSKIRSTGMRRLIYGMLGVSVYAVAVLVPLRDVLIVPMTDPLMMAFWTSKVSEMEPLAGAAIMLYGIIPAMLAVGGLIAGFKCRERARASLLLLCGAGLGLYAMIMFAHVRVGISVHAFFLFLMTLYLNYVFFPREHSCRRTGWFIVFYFLAIATYLRGDALVYRLGAVGLESYKNDYIADPNAEMPEWIRRVVKNIAEKEAAENGTSLPHNKVDENEPKYVCYSLSEEMIKRIKEDNKNGGIWVDIFAAPELLWKTDKPTFGGPYHTNVDGLRDLFFVQLDRGTFDTAYRILKERNITQMFVQNPVCFGYFSNSKNPEEWEKAMEETFMWHLYYETKQLPDWVKLEYTDPKTNAKLFRLKFD